MVLGLAGKLFDYFISYSLDSNAYKSDFVTKGWALIRDLANVMFIFTLLYLAIKHILGGSAKNHIPMLIIVALLINFSLFFTKVAIDAGNILARAFYNSINIENDASAQDLGYKSISLAVLDKINPQKLLSQDFFKLDLVTSGAYSTQTDEIIDTGSVSNLETTLDQNFWYYAFIFILLGIINFILALTFLSMALLFLGRVIGLWFAMIFSPVAFITLAVPGMGGMVSRLNFGAWRDLVLKQAFLAPIVMFFIYLTVMFLQIMFTTIAPPESQDTFMKIMGILIPFIFVVLILTTAKKVANDMSGDIGKTVKEWGGKAAGFVGGAALGATAFAGRAVIGRAASAKLSSGNYNERISNAADRLEDAKRRGDKLSQARALADLKTLELAKGRLEKWKDSSWDIRNAGKSKMLGGAVGGVAGFIGKQGFGQGMTAFGGKDFNVGKGSDKSRKKYEEEKEKEKLKKAEDFSEIGRDEDLAVLLRMANKGFDKKDDIVNSLDKILEETKKSNKLTQQEKDLKVNEMTSLKDAILASQSEKDIKRAIEKGEMVQVGPNGKVSYTAMPGVGMDSRKSKRRNQVADRVERDVWYRLKTGENEYTADKIRKGDKVKSDEEKLLDSIKKLQKNKDENGSENNAPPTPPAGGNPPPSNP
jgi:hypothetical protein